MKQTMERYQVSAKVMFYREACSGHARIDAQFIVDRGQVRRHGARTDHQLFSDLGVGQSLCNEAQDLDLACR